jgi:hypothetical protein
MNSKSLLIAIAAFAVTATGAQAFVGTNYLVQAGLSQTQVEAFTQARELRLKGKSEEARDLLLEAGLDEDAMDSIRAAARAAHEAVQAAIENEDFAAFRTATEGTPLYDIITTEADFKLFVEAHDLRTEGKYEEAREIFDELGVPARDKKGHHGRGMMMEHGQRLVAELTPEQRDALRAARQANDKETVAEILREAGITNQAPVDKFMRHDW